MREILGSSWCERVPVRRIFKGGCQPTSGLYLLTDTGNTRPEAVLPLLWSGSLTCWVDHRFSRWGGYSYSVGGK